MVILFTNVQTINSESCELGKDSNKCSKCDKSNHRLDSFNENSSGECLCEGGYYDDNKNNSLCL